MAGQSLPNQLEALHLVGVVGDLTDGQLLRRHLSASGEASRAALAALVERHGPMVLGVCRHALRDPHDAEDAFQATFLVLVSQARSVREADSVAGWLRGVAMRVAARARADAARRRAREGQAATVRSGQTGSDVEQPQTWPELYEEMARLPARYREPVALCYLDGLTVESAAQRLGCPRGTVLSRLARGKERLRNRLARRGLSPPAVLFSPGLGTIPMAVPAGLLEMTVRVSTSVGGRTAIGAASAPATARLLAERVLQAMKLNQIKLAVLGTLTVGLVFAGAGVIVAQGPTTVGAPEPTRSQAGKTGLERSDKETELLGAIRNARHGRFKLHLYVHNMGEASLGDLIEDSSRLMRSEAELAATREQRDAATQAHLDRVDQAWKQDVKVMKEGAKLHSNRDVQFDVEFRVFDIEEVAAQNEIDRIRVRKGGGSLPTEPLENRISALESKLDRLLRLLSHERR